MDDDTIGDFFTVTGGGGDNNALTSNLDECIVFGNSLHCDKDILIRNYLQKPLDGFLSDEARYSAGNYVIFDSTQSDELVRIITSPGYSGGYLKEGGAGTVIATRMSNILGGMEDDKIQLNIIPLLYHYTTHVPYTTPFSNVTQLHAGYVVEVEHGTLTKMDSYLPLVEDNSGPSNIDEYFSEIASIYRGTEPTLALSGHIDSTALAVALHSNNIDFSALTFDHGPGSPHPVEAGRVTQEIGVDHEIIKIDKPFVESEDIATCLDRMRSDFVRPMIPYFGIRGSIPEGKTLISGINFGAGLKSLMKNPPSRLYQRRNPSFEERLKNGAYYALNSIQNIPFTQLYIENKRFRDAYWQIIPPVESLLSSLGKRLSLYPNLSYSKYIQADSENVDTTFDGVLKGMFVQRFPSVFSSRFELIENYVGDEIYFEKDEYMDSEIERFKQQVSSQPSQATFDLAEFYHHMQGSAKRTSAFSLPSGGYVSIPANWGPSLSHFVGKSVRLNQVIHPKKELYEYVERKMGRSYWDINHNQPPDQKKWPKPSPLLAENAHYFDPERSAVIANLSDSHAKKAVSKIYDKAKDEVEENKYASRRSIDFLQRILNVELLIENNSNT